MTSPATLDRKLLDLAFPEITFVGIDTETTGREPSRARVLEIAAVRTRGIMPGAATKTGATTAIEPDPSECFQTLVRPDTPIPRSSTATHGITEDMVRSAPAVAEALGAFHRWLAECPPPVILVAHNAAFDLDILSYASARARVDVPRLYAFDTLILSRRTMPGAPSYSLESLCRGLSLPTGRFHRALDDARIALDLFRYCVGKGLRATPPTPGANLDLLGEPMVFKPSGKVPPSLAAIVATLDEAARGHKEAEIEVRRSTGNRTSVIRPIAVYPAPEGATAAAFVDLPSTDTEEGVESLALDRATGARIRAGGQGMLFG